LGLFFSSQITKINGGTFTISSLNGNIVLDAKGLSKRNDCFLQGTAVVMELPTKISISMKQLIDKYAPPGNDFNFFEEI
jgi:hypothetical protein